MALGPQFRLSEFLPSAGAVRSEIKQPDLEAMKAAAYGGLAKALARGGGLSMDGINHKGWEKRSLTWPCIKSYFLRYKQTGA